MERHNHCRISLLTLVAVALIATPSVSFAQAKAPVVSAAAAPASGTTAATPPKAATPQKDLTPSPANPMRIAFIDTTGEKGDDVYDELDKAIAADKRVQRVGKEAVLETAKTYKLDKADFRDSKKREKRKADIDKFMSDLRAEALVIVDVFGRGRKAQLVVLDNAGKEVSDQRTNIRKYKISPKTAGKMISKALNAAIPSVVEFRKKGSWKPDAPPIAQAAPEAAPVVTAAAAPAQREEKKDEPTSESGPFHFSAGLYGSYGLLDDLTSNKDNDSEKLAFSAKYPGFVASLNATYFFNKNVGLGFALFGGLSPFTTTLEDEATNTSTKLTSYVAFGQAQLEIPIVVAKGFQIIPFVGGDFHRLSIKPESGQEIAYTGNDFLGLRSGLQFDYAVSIIDLNLSGGVIPSLKSVISPSKTKKEGTYGAPKGKVVFGYEGRLTLAVRVLSMLDVVLGYDFRYVSTQLKDAGDQFSAPPTFRAINHNAFFGLRYVL